MEHDVNNTSFKSGYAGNDSMRDKAADEFGATNMKHLHDGCDRPGSFSAMSRTPMRLYKKGGHVDHEEHPGKDKKRMHLHRKQERELKDIHNLIEKEKTLKKGGRFKLTGKVSGSFMPKHRPHGNIDGGSLTNLHIPKEMGFGKSLKSPKLHIEKGSKMKMRMGGETETKVYKKGGHAKHHSHGGSIYEREMMGEHPSHTLHTFNYEGMMRGEHPKHKAAHGGHMKEDHFAAGGAAKVRHKEATHSGKPIHKHDCKVKVY